MNLGPITVLHPVKADFDATLRAAGAVGAAAPNGLRREATQILQVNLGKRCNMACHHCHVEAGPKRTETMSQDVADKVLALLAASPQVGLLDLTGGAPELNASFRGLVAGARALGRRVIDRCNLTVLFEPGMEDLPAFLAKHQVEIVASLPCYLEENVQAQRGPGAFGRSIDALQLLNQHGYGQPGGDLLLSLVYNPVGPVLPPAQQGLEEAYRQQLGDRFGLTFTDLITLTNMPIARFADALRRSGQADAYKDLLRERFNPATVAGLMCRSMISVSWDGRIYDCDFNQMLDLPMPAPSPATVWDLDSLDDFEGRCVTTASHCFGCTAGAGSSCSGALS